MKRFIYGFLTSFLLLPSLAYAAGGTLYLSPATGSYSIGQGFDVQVLANTDTQPVNAIEGELAYNPLYFSVERISTDHSVLTSWATPPSYDGAEGLIKFSGWADTNYNGQSGLLITVHLVPLRAGQSSLDFNSGAMLSGATNIITTMKSAAFALQPAQIAAPALPPQPAATDTSAASAATPTEQNAQNAAAVPLSNATSSQAAAVLFASIDVATPYLIFFAVLVGAAFLIAYYFHKKNIAF